MIFASIFRPLSLVLSSAAILNAALLAQAQAPGSVRGIVENRNGQPVAGATVTLVALDSSDVRYETITDDTGHFQQLDLSPGQYSLNAFKDEIGDQIFRVLVHPASSVAVYFRLEEGQTAAPWLRVRQDRQDMAEVFAAGVRANRVGEFEDAIEQFEAALKLTPTCVDCYFNIGVSYSRLNRFSEAEASYRRALQVRPDYNPAYYGLADVFVKQDRPEDAAAAREEANRIAVRTLAAGRAFAQDTLGRGIDSWNSGRLTDALRQFQAAQEADPALAAVHYWLGLAHNAAGNSARARRAWSRYLGAAPDGEYAESTRQRLVEAQH